VDAGGVAIGDIPADAPARIVVNSLMEKLLAC